MTLNPFVFGSASKPSCFDESSPCLLEQTSMCVIDVAVKADSNAQFPGQSVYVPWLVCMDSDKDNTKKCNAQVGVDSSAVQTCLKSDAASLLKQYLKVDKSIRATPTVEVNGKKAKTSFSSIKKAICKADSSLAGCSQALPENSDHEAAVQEVPRDVIV